MARPERGAPGGGRHPGSGAGGLTEAARLEALARAVRGRGAPAPRVAFAPGSDLPELGALEPDARLTGAELDAPGAELRVGRLHGVGVALLLGTGSATAGLRVARLLGAEVLLLARRAHALEEGASGADLGVVEDHIGLLVPNPLVGPNPDELGPRFPDLSEPYDRALRGLAREEAERAGRALAGGVYAAHPEPNLATPAEYRMLRRLGADWVGRGGVPEAVVARHAGMRVLALVGLPGAEQGLADLALRVLGRLG